MQGRWKGSRRLVIEFWVWMILGIPSILWWRESVFWVVFMSWYAIVKSIHTDINATRAKEQTDDD